jgi:hypothetical protein
MKRFAVLVILVVIALPAVALSLFSNFQVLPATVSLVSNDPDATPTPGSATVTWNNLLGLLTSSWTLSVAANSSLPLNCPAVPSSAFSVKCSSISVSGIALPTYACAGPVALSTTYQTIASGIDGTVLTLGATHTVSVAVGFADSWKYPVTGAACSLSLMYSLVAQ